MKLKYFFFNFFFFLVLCLISNNSYSDNIFSSINKNTKTFLKIDDAFKVSLFQKNKELIIINYKIHNGYYLYKDKIKLFINDKEFYDFSTPASKTKEDEFFGISEIYDSDFIISVNYPGNIYSLVVHYQGCANNGLCYPPKKKELISTYLSKKKDFVKIKVSEPDYIFEKILSNNIFINILLFIGFGLLLSFTPCILPMIPILSGVILKSNVINTKNSFLLSFYYVLGLTFVYLLMGLFLGYAASIYNIQSVFQKPIYLLIFIFILIALSFSMFGFYEIKIPRNIQGWAMSFSDKTNTGKYSSSFVMGFVSALIVGPCVAPPLAGIFLYVTAENPGSLVTGILFFSLGLGMSIPLLVYGTFIGKYVPKTGKWMKFINYFIGVLLLFVALTFIDRLVPILKFSSQESNLIFKKVENVKDLKRFLRLDNGKITLVDVYADWCVECKLMEQKTFSNTEIESLLKDLNLLKVDVTNNKKEDVEILKYLKVIGPPAYKFFDIHGDEIKAYGIQGYMGPLEFKLHLLELKNH